MAKDPAINWYFDNWNGGTFGMSRFHKGCYMDLLSAQYHIGHLSLEQIKNILGNDFSAWQVLKQKFAQDENKNFFNERLAAEVRKRNEYSKRQSETAKKRWKKSHGIFHGISHGNANGNAIIGTGTVFKEEEALNKVRGNPALEEVERVFIQQGGTKEMAAVFFNSNEATAWHHKGSKITKWNSLVSNFITSWHNNRTGKTDSISRPKAGEIFL